MLSYPKSEDSAHSSSSSSSSSSTSSSSTSTPSFSFSFGPILFLFPYSPSSSLINCEKVRKGKEASEIMKEIEILVKLFVNSKKAVPTAFLQRITQLKYLLILNLLDYHKPLMENRNNKFEACNRGKLFDKTTVQIHLAEREAQKAKLVEFIKKAQTWEQLREGELACIESSLAMNKLLLRIHTTLDTLDAAGLGQYYNFYLLPTVNTILDKNYLCPSSSSISSEKESKSKKNKT